MAVYKVPQDVEADDKLIGPFSFRQFIYLIVVAVSIATAYGLSKLFIALAILPMPIIVFFGILALPLRKDQPMETYLSAVVSFYFLKPRRRMWQPDGIDSFITIIPPKSDDIRRTKDLNEDEATKRLDYLASLVDSHGWSVRGAGVPAPDTSINDDLYYESQATKDMMDTNNDESQRLTQSLASSAQAARDSAVTTMQYPPSSTTTAQDQAIINPPVVTPVQPVGDDSSLTSAAMSNPMLASAPVLDPFVSADQYQMGTSFSPAAAPAPEQATPSTPSILDRDQLDAIAYANALTEEAGESPQQPDIAPLVPNAEPLPVAPELPIEPVMVPLVAAAPIEQPVFAPIAPPLPPEPVTFTPVAPPAYTPELAPAAVAPAPTIIPPQTTSAIPTPDATIERAQERARELASRQELSVQTVSEEAKRLEEKEKVLTGHDEVTISFR